MNQPRKLDMVLDSGADRLVERAKALLRLERLVLGHLAPNLAAHCRLANANEDTLVLQVDNPAWAGRLRHQSRTLLAELKGNPAFESISRIRVTVRPPHVSRSDSRPARATPLSERSAEAIEATAQGVGDPALSAALRRLSRRRP